MITIKEQQERKNTIGASEVHKLYNFDNQSCQDMWEEKVGLKQREEIDNDSIDAGNILEEDCLDFYARNNNVEIVKNERIEHETIDNFIVSLDARKGSTPIENKCIGEEVFKKWFSKKVSNASDKFGNLYNIPINYYLQLQSQMCCLDSERGILLANTLTQEEVLDPLNVEITDIHQKELFVNKSEIVWNEIEKRVSYMLECIKYKKRPNENEYLQKCLYNQS